MTESQVVVFQSLKYSSDVINSIGVRIMGGMKGRTLGRNLLSHMRTCLSVPAIFTTLRILRRLQAIMDDGAKCFERGEFHLRPKNIKKNHVDYTVAQIYSEWARGMLDSLKVSLNFDNPNYNPYRKTAAALDEVIAYVANKQFGIELN
jgi:hypothetical protein